MTELNPTELARIANEGALAAVIVDEAGRVISAVNNNSICEVLSASSEFGSSCAEFCGRAYERAAGNESGYRCFAGLDCVVTRLRSEKPLVAIVGRVFTSADNYRSATERAIAGDWKQFPPTRVFDNVLLTSSLRNIEDAAAKIEALGVTPKAVEKVEKVEKAESPVVETPVVVTPIDEKPEDETPEEKAPAVTEKPPEPVSGSEETPIPMPDAGELPGDANDQKAAIEQMLREFNERPAELMPISGPPTAEAEELAAWRSFFGSLASLKYRDACESILEFLARRYGVHSLGWLELRDRGFEVIAATGALAGQQFKIRFGAEDRRLFEAIESEQPLRLRESRKSGEKTERSTVSMFPIAVGDEVQNALVVADDLGDDELTRHLARFCHSVASEIEVLRLREEVRRRGQMARAVERFNASLKGLDTEDFWSDLMQLSAELMSAERSSLLLFDEKADRLSVRAAIGTTAEEISLLTEGVGERVARGVLTKGEPVVVGDVGKIGIGPAPVDWRYKTSSFICYPFMIGDRRIGVLNVADKADGTAYSEMDLEVLEAIAPQVAVVIDRAALKNKAGEFEQLSVTDPLTGLLNRRYLEERLAEEIKRSNRYGYPMAFLMIDVDDFGKFNKDFGVLVGDRVLRESVKAMKATLRGADIAARYGGEEFCVLLPQTTLAEARTIAERIRQSVENIEFDERGITVSIGISTFSYGVSGAEEVIRAADEAMRRAKSSGKNNVQISEAADQG